MMQPRLPLRCICRAADTTHSSPRRGFANRRSMSFSLDYSDNDNSNYHNSFSSSADSSLGDSYSSNKSSSSDFEPIDDLVDELVAEATKHYTASSNAVTNKNGKAVWSPEQQTIDLAVKRLDIPYARGGSSKSSYYELRMLANQNTFVDSITSVLIGYAQLEGVDQGTPLRRFTFQDSQHLYLFCEQLGQKGRFEDAAF